MSAPAFDTSVAVPYLVRSHDAHKSVRRQVAGRTASLTAHSMAETYAVLTRLPGDARLTAHDAARLLDANFGAVLVPDAAVTARIHTTLAAAGIVGGAVYDALVGLAAENNGAVLLTRDARAIGTYAAVGASIEVLQA